MSRQRPSLERLEDRVVPTSTVFLDFGEGFAGGQLLLTVDALERSVGDGGYSGPDLEEYDIPDDLTLTFRSLRSLMASSPAFQVDHTGNGAYTDADYVALRDDILRLVQRQYAPFDVNVQLASAASRTDVRNALSANARDRTGENDAYVFVVGVFAPNGMSIGARAGLYGLASGRDVGGTNDEDDSAIVFAENLLADYVAGPVGSAATWLANVASHEAGHTFGLPHVVADTAAQSELMNVGIGWSGATLGNRAFFSRITYTGADENPITGYPLYEEVNPYEWLAGDGDIGPQSRRGSPAYITGTGGDDRIELSRDGDRIRVFVNGHTLYHVSPANGLLVELGMGDDAVYIDAAVATGVRVVGGAGRDAIVVLNGSSGTYTPDVGTFRTLDWQTSYGGTIEAGSTRITFEEFEPDSAVEARNFTSFTFVTPGSDDEVAIDGYILDDGSGGGNTVSGTSDGVAFVPLTVRDVSILRLDTGRWDRVRSPLGGADTIELRDPGLTTRGLSQFVVRAGRGDDVLTLSGDSQLNLVGGGAFRFEGGTGFDTIVIDAVQFGRVGAGVTALSGVVVNASPIDLDSVQEVRLTGTEAGDVFSVTEFDGLVVIDAAGGDDDLTVTRSGTTRVGTSFLPGLGYADTVGSGGSITYARGVEDLVVSGGLATVTDRVTIDNAQSAVRGTGLRSLAVHTNDGDDVVTLTSAAVRTLVFTGGGADAVTVESTALAGAVIDTGTENDTISLTPDTRDLAALPRLEIVAGAGVDSLTIDDRNNPYARGFGHNYRIDAGSVGRDRAPTAPIGDPPPPIRVTYSGVDTLTVRTGGQADVVSVESLPGATTLETWGGNDTVRVTPTLRNLEFARGLTVVGGSGPEDTVELYDQNNPYTVGALSGLYTLTADTLTRYMAQPGQPTLPVPFSINVAGADNVHLMTGNQHNVVLVQGTPGDTVIDGGALTEQFVVGPNLASLTGLLTLHGGGGVNTLAVSDAGAASGATHRYRLGVAGSMTTVDVGTARRVEADGIVAATFRGSEWADVIRVDAALVPTAVDAGAGIDDVTVRLDQLAAGVLVDGGADRASLTTQDASAVGQRYALGYNLEAGRWGVARGGAVAVTYANVGTLAVHGTGAADALDVTSTEPGLVISVVGGGGDDTLTGSNGINAYFLDGFNTGVHSGTGSEVAFFSFENLLGQGGSDRLFVRAAGRLTGSFVGGGGYDWIDYTAWTDGVEVNLLRGTATAVGGGVSGIEEVRGGSGDDLLVGDGESNALFGNAGRDVLIGGAGADALDGGAGDDLLIGGATTGDNDPAWLSGVRASWTQPLTYPERIASLRDRLTTATVLEDDAVDVLTGGLDTDWFWALLGDTTDRDPLTETLG